MKNATLLKMQHTSLQRNDTPRQQEHDIRKLFSQGKQFPIKTGTEAGRVKDMSNHNRELLHKFADEFNHRIHFSRECWVAVDRSIIAPGSVKTGQVRVAGKEQVKGKSFDVVFPTFVFNHVDERVGRIAQAATHYPTRGGRPGDPNYEINKRYAREIHKWMRSAGARSALAFANGDFNMNDRELDWAFGRPFTSMGDELDKYPGTGHGPIDGFTSYNKDARVRAKRLVVLNDKQMKMFTDHFVCRGTWIVNHLSTN